MYSALKIDLHMHTNVSDGSDTPEEIVEKVRNADIGVFSVTDHDAVKACRIIRNIIKPDDPKFICGAEFSSKDEFGKYHILAYYDDPSSPPINSLVDKSHDLRMKKVAARLERLKDEFGVSFSEEETKNLLSLDNPGKPHIANLMVKYGFVRDKSEAFKDYLNKLHVPSAYVRPEEVIVSITEGGGIPVLAHPFFGDGDQLIIGDEMEERLKRLIGFGLKGVEAFYSGFSPKLTKDMLAFADKYDLYVTAGSDYHGSNKLVRLGENGTERLDRFPDGTKRFLERFF